MTYSYTTGPVFKEGATTVRTLSNHLADEISVLDFGVVGDGITDDTAALNTALTAAVSRNRSRVFVPPTVKMLINSGDILFPEGVSLIGSYDTMGEFVNGGSTTARDYHNAGSSIILNSAYSLKLNDRNKLQNLLIISKPVYDLMPCTNLAGVATIVGAFAGKGVYAFAAYDIQIDRCMFLGFQYGIQSLNNGAATCERARITHCLFDCTNCVDWTWATDFAYFESLHAWNFVTSHIGGITGPFRSGTAFRMGPRCDWPVMLNCSSYGWNRGFAADGAGAVMFIGCKSDNNGQNTGSIGFDITDFTDGTGTYKPALTSLVGCKTAAHDTGLRINCTDTVMPTVNVTDWTSWGGSLIHIDLQNGALLLNNAVIRHGTTGINISATAVSAALTNVWFQGPMTTNVINSLGTAKVSQVNVFDKPTTKMTNSFPSLSTTALWNEGHMTLGSYHLWIDASGRLRIKSSAPTSDTDGTVVGTQT